MAILKSLQICHTGATPVPHWCLTRKTIDRALKFLQNFYAQFGKLRWPVFLLEAGSRGQGRH